MPADEQQIETMIIERSDLSIKLWAKFEVIPPPIDEEYVNHHVLELRLNDEQGPVVTVFYEDFSEVTEYVDDAITTELN